MRVLVTGAAGSLGRVVTFGLADLGHEVVCLDIVPAVDGTPFVWHEADCADADAVEAVFDAERLDAVVHLAGVPEERPLPEELTSHVVTTAALLDAMVTHDVPRLVYASSNHAVGRTPRADGELTEQALPRPDTYYGVAKVAAEALMRLFADRHGIDAVACRIGSFLEEPTTVRNLSTWLSHGDGVRMVQAALTAPAPGFAVLHGISANTRGWWDLEPGRRLGYEPQDDAEAYADRIEPRPEDEAEAEFVGGPYATAQFHRPALSDAVPGDL
ncbi:NAD-dependent dehydratase [Nocardioides flavus (ex Wang et al. 2016)]|uniref:NAD-dependent dehydratase n=1 Tax=Nocardioides flavus (ex Wang et al. 2016) TaxID=2058780 RepID=A0ABQ3HJ91_9ACTN|nr:NAD(P)-dependent oxidoreductase [Nocardioides flavus (ex Wang et al. 2016)]GHE16968.1 NAD-dependent dehydratase [Nocardioides flavus (ex Wang et al. 2016)]